jgi:MFS family permease
MQKNPGNRWIVLAAAVPILALVMGQLVNGLSVYFVPLEVEFGWDRGDIALINSVGLVGLALGSIVMGFAADRFGVRWIAFMGIVLAFGYMGHGLGGWQGGFFYDLTSAYTWSYANAVLSGLINLSIIGALWWTVNRRGQLSLA